MEVSIDKEELSRLITDAVRDGMHESKREDSPRAFIKGIHELAKFLRVSPARAQKLKNEGSIPFWQDGRTLLFDPDKVRDVMYNVKRKDARK